MATPWTTALSEIRNQLSDGATDKLRYRKYIIGVQNGLNTAFKTLEFRRITAFTDVAQPTNIGVFKNGVRLVPGVDVLTDDLPSSEFTLAVAPINADQILCTYYIQFFIDSELVIFLQNASRWLGFSDDYTQVPTGLQPSALKYATADGYQKLSMRWAEHLSETYRTEDSVDPKRMEIVSAYHKASITFRDDATKLRDHFYTRQGRSLSPLFGSNLGNITSVEPRR